MQLHLPGHGGHAPLRVELPDGAADGTAAGHHVTAGEVGQPQGLPHPPGSLAAAQAWLREQLAEGSDAPFEILQETEREIDEGTAHRGLSATVQVAYRRPIL